MFYHHLKPDLDRLINLNLSSREKFLLIPVLFATGIGAYFSLDYKPELERTLWGFFACFLVFIFTYYSFRQWKLISVALLIFASGFTLINLKAVYVKSPIIQEDLGVIWLRGKMEKIEDKGSFKRLVINEVDLWQPEKKNFSPEETPLRIRVNVRTNITDDVAPGDIVKAKIILSPPARLPVFPRGYDFAKWAYFERIGAVGYAISDVEVFEKGNDFINLNKVRESIENRIKNNIDNKNSASVITALITGERGQLDEEAKEKIRNAGLGHILAISGLHMSIIMVWSFIFIRYFLALFPSITLNYDTKRIGAYISLLIGLFYLMITGFPVSARRAYIMVTIFFLAIILNRHSSVLRPVAVAAIIILFFEPEALVTPGFQMSFAAVVGLIGFYEFLRDHYKHQFYDKPSLSKKIILYFGGIVITTIIASMVTSPFAIYHFNQFPKYGVIGNLIGIPAVTFIVLPFAFLATILMPVGLEVIFLKISEVGVAAIFAVSNYVDGLSNNKVTIAQFPVYIIAMIAYGWCFFFIFKSKIRYIFLLLVAIGSIGMFTLNIKPDFIVSEKANLFVVKDENSYKFYGSKRSSFTIDQWAENLGINGDVYFDDDNQSCSINRCEVDNVFIGKQVELEDCDKFDVVVNLSNDYVKCLNAKVVNKAELSDYGTHLIFHSGEITNSAIEQGQRLWSR